jgi:hypothetical protein
VDQVLGNDSTASPSGTPYRTVQAAVAAATSGKTIWVMPGTYNLTSGITIPTGVAMRGINNEAVVLQMTATADATLVTMGEFTRIEDMTLNLISSGHYTLKGIVFPGTTTTNSKIRMIILTVDNSAASSSGTSNVYGVECSGTGVPSVVSSAFSFNAIKAGTIAVLSNGQGNKRGILISNANILTVRDINVYVAAPREPTASTGSYVGVETNDPNAGNYGSFQVRTSTIGAIQPGVSGTFTASDVLQTTPSTITDPTYLVSPGIQIGPGTDILTKTAGLKPFTTYVYPTKIFWGLRGNITSGPSGGWLWPGTEGVSAGVYPDTTYPAAHCRIQTPDLLLGMTASLSQPVGSAQTVTVTVYRTAAADAPGDASSGALGTKTKSTVFTVQFTGTQTDKTYFNSSIQLGVGDRLHVYLTYTGNSGTNLAHDLTCQLSLF